MNKFVLFDECNNVTIDYYKPEIKTSQIGIVIFPGGGYCNLAPHEGGEYAKLFTNLGITAFVVNYRVAPNKFPKPLIDARRAMRFVRYNAEKFGLDKNKILAMGSSAGGHLTALLSTYKDELDEPHDEIYNEEYLPNGQILCYPVISSNELIIHKGSFENFLGELYINKEKFSPESLVLESTPPAFIWHTATDNNVSYLNSFRYAEALIDKGVHCELHLFPVGRHGLGLSNEVPHVLQWIELLKNWIINFFEE